MFNCIPFQIHLFHAHISLNIPNTWISVSDSKTGNPCGLVSAVCGSCWHLVSLRVLWVCVGNVPFPLFCRDSLRFGQQLSALGAGLRLLLNVRRGPLVPRRARACWYQFQSSAQEMETMACVLSRKGFKLGLGVYKISGKAGGVVIGGLPGLWWPHSSDSGSWDWEQ